MIQRFLATAASGRGERAPGDRGVRGLRVTGHPGRGSALWQAPSMLLFVHTQGLSGASPGPRANGHRWVWSSHSDVSSRFVRSRAQERRSVPTPVFSSRAPRGE